MSETDNVVESVVCSSDNKGCESRVSSRSIPDEDESSSNEAEAKPVNSPEGTKTTAVAEVGVDKQKEPDLVSSTKESSSCGQISRDSMRARDTKVDDEEDDEDDDSNDGVGATCNSDRELFHPPICSPYSLHSSSSSSNSKSNPFGSGGGGLTQLPLSQNYLRGPILRPSAFKFSCTSQQQSSSSCSGNTSSSSSSSGFVLRPPKLIPNSGSVGCKVPAQGVVTSSGGASASDAKINNVFVPLGKDDGGGAEELGGSNNIICSSNSSSNRDIGGCATSSSSSSSSSTSCSSSSVTTRKSATTADGASSTSAEFVFGRNCEERAVPMSAGSPSGKKRKIEGDSNEEEERDSSSSSSGVKKPSVVISSSGEDCGVAGDIVREVITGEEGEVNALQLHCRLFIFDSSNSTWVERGRGLLRLNDSKTPDENNSVSSRLIVRSKGSLRVMLNTKVWDGMRVEKVGDKNVRLMAVDLEAVEKEEDGGSATGGDTANSASAVRIFLIMTTSISDAYTLVNELESRVRRLSN